MMHATPIVTVQTSKFFSVTKNSNIAQVCARLPIEHVLKIVTLKNFDGYTSCMPSSLKEYSYSFYPSHSIIIIDLFPDLEDGEMGPTKSIAT